MRVLVCKLGKVRHRDKIRESFDSSGSHTKLEIERSLMKQAYPKSTLDERSVGARLRSFSGVVCTADW